METDFPGFHENTQFSANLLSSDEVMKDQLKILEGIKIEGNILWPEISLINDAIEEQNVESNVLENIKTEENILWPESILNESTVGKEDFQQIMSDWQNHVGPLQISEPEDVDVHLDLLSTSDVLFEESSLSLNKTMNNSIKKLEHNSQLASESLGIKRESIYGSGAGETYQKNQFEQKLNNGNVRAEPTVVRKLTLINGDKEILGKNIIGLHSLNEIKENPDQNCQVTSTVINGKKYKIIIKPKSQNVKKFTEKKVRKSLIKNLSRSDTILKAEPKEDEITIEMRNGNYDVPLLGNDLFTSWDVAWMNSTWDNKDENNLNDITATNDAGTPKKVPPLRIKIPKTVKREKSINEMKSDEEIDVETVGEKSNEDKFGGKKFKVNYQQNYDQKFVSMQKVGSKNFPSKKSIKSSLPKAMVDQIESLKRKKDGRIPLVQVVPVRKHTRSGTRMQDAGAIITRNKLLKIVSGGDTVQLDHDYCSNSFKHLENSKNKIMSDSDINLAEKNPKKDSGMESGDVSDASEEPQTPDNVYNAQSIQQINSKILEQKRNGKANNITKVAAAFFRATNAITSNFNVNNSDVVKTLVVSNGNKALTNDNSVTCINGDKSDKIHSGSEFSNTNEVFTTNVGQEDKSSISNTNSTQQSSNDHPKKKLKLEEYLSRRNGKTVDSSKDSAAFHEQNRDISSNVEVIEGKSSVERVSHSRNENFIKDEKEGNKEQESIDPSSIHGKKSSRQYRSERSSSTSSGERNEKKRKENSHSRSLWKGNARDSRSRHKYRSSSKERRRSFWSRSLSRSSSRESSSSSDRSAGRRKHKSSPVWYRRRSRSRSLSRERSRFRNRSYSDRRRQNHYFNRNFYNRRLRSPFHSYSMREKQRQIEERRVIYIGRIEEGMTNAKLRERFSVFGPIVDISLHFREYGDNYGFVTYAYKDDAYDAVEHGNDDPNLPRYDLCFGGRRGFCKEKYADLDGMPTSYSDFKDSPVPNSSEESFDLLLKKAQAKLKKRLSKSDKT